jgi:hypothetical protein
MLLLIRHKVTRPMGVVLLVLGISKRVVVKGIVTINLLVIVIVITIIIYHFFSLLSVEETCDVCNAY